MHIIFNVQDMEGWFGYKYMSSFLYAIGNRLCLISVGLLFIFASNQIHNEYRKTFKIVSFMVLYVGCFFGATVLISKKWLMGAFGVRDLHSSFYYASMVIMAISSGYVLNQFQNAIMWTEIKLRKQVEYLTLSLKKAFSFMHEETEEKKWIKENKIDEHAIRRLEVTDEIVLGYD